MMYDMHTKLNISYLNVWDSVQLLKHMQNETYFTVYICGVVLS